jgi:hypothetical protein
MATFGENLDLHASNTQDDMEGYNRVRAVQRAVDAYRTRRSRGG